MKIFKNSVVYKLVIQGPCNRYTNPGMVLLKVKKYIIVDVDISFVVNREMCKLQ